MIKSNDTGRLKIDVSVGDERKRERKRKGKENRAINGC